MPRGLSVRPAAADPLTLEAVRALGRTEGRALLARAATSAGAEWQQQDALRRNWPAPLCRAAVALTQLRAAARPKLADAEAMFFDRAGLEMATRTEVARHRAVRLAGRGRVLDLCCGIGGDLVELARRCPVIGVDADPRRVLMARLNCEALGAAPDGLAVADVTTLRLRAATVYVDPARRDDSDRYSRRGQAYSPPLAFAVELQRRVPGVAIKLGPAIDQEELPADWEAEFVSAGGQCRECALYSQPLASAQRRATILPAGDSLASAPGPRAPVAPPGAFVYDPDPAVVRAHLIDELARLLDAWKLDPQVAYLSTSTHRPSPFARGLRVLAVQPYQPLRLRRLLAREGWRPQEIRKRHFPLTPEMVRRQLGPGVTGMPVTLVLTRLAGRPTCMVCTEVA